MNVSFQTLLTLLSVMLCATASGAPKPLLDAVELGDVDTVRQLLRQGADVNEAYGDGMSALHLAAESGNAELAKTLIYAGGNLESGTRIGNYTALHVASRSARPEVVRVLLAAKANVHARTTNSGVMPLHLAAESGNTEVVQALIDAGADVNEAEHAWGQTPLVFAASANRVAVIQALLEADADPALTSWSIDVIEREKADKASEKRLSEFLAEFKRQEGGGPNWQPSPSQVQAAIEAAREIQRRWPDVPDPSCDDSEGADGNDGNAQNKCSQPVKYNADGEPIYDYASNDEENGDAEPKPASYGELVGSWGGLTPLLHAVRQGHSESALALIDGGADINQVSAGDKTTPLLMATINGQFDLALKLVTLGADPNLASSAGTTPLFAVLERNWAPRASYAHPVEHQQQDATHYDVMAALLEAGAEPDVRLQQPLWFSEYTFKVLGQAGIHYQGATPFWRAAQALDLDAMRLLKKYGANTETPTVKLPARRRSKPDPVKNEIATADAKISAFADSEATPAAAAIEQEEEDEDKDHSGLPEIPVGGPFIHPIHAAAGAGYGQSYAGNAHRYVPQNWQPTVKFLVEECGADVNTRDANGYTALHHAASRGDNELIKYLVEKGADVMVVSRKGQTTADMANGPIQRVAPFPETIKLLVELGAINNNKCVSC